MAITIEKLKENFEKDGKTLAAWARENGYKPREVYLKRSSERFERDPLDSFSDDLFVCGKVLIL